MGNSRTVAAMLAALLLTACIQGASVTIDQSGSRVVAVVDRGGKRVCVDDLDVSEVQQGTNEPVRGVWHISTADIDLCLSRFTLGEVPAGFDQDAPMVPLVAGRQYLVSVSGTGFMGADSFTAAASVGVPGGRGPASPLR